MSWGFFPSLRSTSDTHTRRAHVDEMEGGYTVNGVPGVDGGVVCEVEFPLSRELGDNMAGNGGGA